MAKRDSKGKFLKGVSGNPDGVPKGLKQRSTEIKEAFFDAFEKTGGVKKLIKYVNKNDLNRKEFYSFLIRLLPKEVELEADFREPTPTTPPYSIVFMDAKIPPHVNEKDITRTDCIPASSFKAGENK